MAIDLGALRTGANNFVRSIVPTAVRTAAQVLPNIQGSGWVRDLQEAATQSPQLVAAFTAVKDATSSAEHRKERARACSRLKQRSLRGKYGCSQRGVCASSYEKRSEII